ncbi:hypothetical protein EDD11_010186 [Mortierella claussenii]|nr:hypothetical protein EDD11_010186 [Mortierella claussenii]
MTRLRLILLAIVVVFSSIPSSNACESGCREESVKFLAAKYAKLLHNQVQLIQNPQQAQESTELISKAILPLQWYDGPISQVIFSTFKGSCPHAPGWRTPEELCGSAKSIACHAAWDHQNSVLRMAHDAAVQHIRKVYAGQSSAVQDVMVNQVAAYCPNNCKDWVEPFQGLMLEWELEDHRDEYEEMPNCLPLGRGGV